MAFEFKNHLPEAARREIDDMKREINKLSDRTARQSLLIEHLQADMEDILAAPPMKKRGRPFKDKTLNG